MYKDQSKNPLWVILGVFIAAVLLVYGGSAFSKRANADLDEESALSIHQAIEDAALQCYVIEGSYPEDLDYLKENYGLRINEKNYYVVYRAYAQNQLPDIRIVRK